MAAGSYTTETLVTSIRRRAYLPPTDDGVTFPRDSDLIALANEEMVTFLVPWILRQRENHFATYTDIALVASQNDYLIPSRAVGNFIFFATLVDANGNPMFSGLVEQDLEIAVQFSQIQPLLGQPTRYYWKGNYLSLVPAPADTSLKLRIWFPQRPNQLVATSGNVGTITTLTNNGGASYTVAFSGGPAAGFANSVVVECVHSQPGFEPVALGTTTSSGVGAFTITGAMPTTIAVGDYVSLQDTANVPTNVPADCVPLFAQWIALKYAEIHGDESQLGRTAKVFDRCEKITRAAYLGKRDKLNHRKLSSTASRSWGRRPLYQGK